MWPFRSEAKVLEEVRRARALHFRERFGLPSEEEAAPPEAAPVARVLIYEPTATRPRWSYLTDGMSDRSQDKSFRKNREDVLRIELALHLRDEVAWAVPVLCRLGAMPWGENRCFGPWQAIELGEPVDGKSGSGLDGVLLLPTMLDGDGTSRVARTKEAVELLWVVPAFRTERELLTRRPKDLQALITTEVHESLTDLERRPLC
jgi:hypothetical protein